MELVDRTLAHVCNTAAHGTGRTENGTVMVSFIFAIFPAKFFPVNLANLRAKNFPFSGLGLLISVWGLKA